MFEILGDKLPLVWKLESVTKIEQLHIMAHFFVCRFHHKQTLMSIAKMEEKNSPIDYIEAKESRWEHDAAAKKHVKVKHYWRFPCAAD